MHAGPTGLNQEGTTWYVQNYQVEDRHVLFNVDGTYNSKTGDDSSSKGCLGQSIAQLYQSGRAFNFVTSKVADSTGASTMIKGWPDAIKCGATYSQNAVFLLHAGPTGLNQEGTAWYVQNYQVEDRHVLFNVDGTYNSKTGDDSSSKGCLGQSIAQLYQSGRAFNFVTSKVADSTGASTMIKGWPDAIKCGATYSQNAVFLLHAGPTGLNQEGTAWYVQNYQVEDRHVLFNADGTYNSRTGNDESSKGCLGQSIAQLYQSGRAFNFVTSKVVDSNASGTDSTGGSSSGGSSSSGSTGGSPSGGNSGSTGTSSGGGSSGGSSSSGSTGGGSSGGSSGSNGSGGSTSGGDGISISSSTSISISAGAVVGIVIGGIVGVVAVCVGSCLLYRYCKRRVHNFPIGIEMSVESGLRTVALRDSSVMFAYDDVRKVRTSWINGRDEGGKKGAALLAYDHNMSGTIDYAKEIVFTSWVGKMGFELGMAAKNDFEVEGSEVNKIVPKTDFEALLQVFDTNGDCRLTAEDAEFDKFLIWKDANNNGVSEAGEITSLRNIGIKVIDFSENIDMCAKFAKGWKNGGMNTGEILELALGNIAESIPSLEKAVESAEFTISSKNVGSVSLDGSASLDDSVSLDDDTQILNTAKVLWEDGTVTTAYDLVFIHA